MSTSSMGRKSGKRTTARCRRCGRKSYHIIRKKCSSCGYGDTAKLRKYAWQTKYTINGVKKRKPTKPNVRKKKLPKTRAKRLK